MHLAHTQLKVMKINKSQVFLIHCDENYPPAPQRFFFCYLFLKYLLSSLDRRGERKRRQGERGDVMQPLPDSKWGHSNYTVSHFNHRFTGCHHFGLFWKYKSEECGKATSNYPLCFHHTYGCHRSVSRWCPERCSGGPGGPSSPAS